MAFDTLANGKVTFGMGEGYKSGQMEHVTREIGDMVRHTVRVNSNMLMETYMRVTGFRINSMVTAPTCIKMELNTLAAGTKTSKKVMALKNGSMALSTRATIRIVLSTVKVSTPGRMVHNTVAIGLTTKSVAQAHTSG